MPQKDDLLQGLVPQINKGKDALSKLQRQFNSKVSRIQNLKAAIAAKKATVEQLQKRVQQELFPLSEEVVTTRVKLARTLDEAYSMPVFRKNESKKLAALIEDLCFILIDEFGKEELIPIHDKYAFVSYADARRMAEDEAKARAQEIFKDFFGTDLDLENLQDLEEMKEHIRQQAEAQAQNKKEKQAKRKKTKAQEAKEEALKAEMSNISKASRRIYTNLAKLLHPDREQDENLRAWKEEEIKKVTAAYNNNDFYELLRLQLEFVQDKENALDELPEEQLNYYLRLLSEQVKELEVESEKFMFGPGSELLHKFGGTPKQAEQKFRSEKAELRRELKMLQSDLKFLSDPANIKIFLKEIR